MFTFIRDEILPAALGAIAGATLSVATPLPASTAFFNLEIEDEHANIANLVKHGVSAIAGAVISHLLSHSTLGSRDKEGKRSWGSFLYSAASAIVLPTAGVFTAAEAFSEIQPSSSSTANTVLASCASAATIATFSYIGIKPFINAAKLSIPKQTVLVDWRRGIFSEDLDVPFIPLKEEDSQKPSKCQSAAIQLSGLLTLLSGAAAGAAASASTTLPTDLKFFNLDIKDDYVNDANIAKHVISSVLGLMLMALISQSTAGYRLEDGKRSWPELVYSITTLLTIAPIGIALGGLAYPHIRITNSTQMNEALASLLVAGTILAFIYAGAKPFINDFYSQSKPKARFADSNEDTVNQADNDSVYHIGIRTDVGSLNTTRSPALLRDLHHNAVRSIPATGVTGSATAEVRTAAPDVGSGPELAEAAAP